MPDDSLTVLVPVLDRPQNVRPLVESFRAGGSGGRLVFVCQMGDDDEIAAVREVCDEAQSAPSVSMGRQPEVSDLIVRDATTWPEKIGAAMWLIAPSEWYLLGADDITFEPGWFQASAKARSGHALVVGTNDSGNPRCSVSGIHSTHPLVHRSWRAMGEKISPVHTGYGHWFCDDDLIYTAKARGVWAWCEDARVTHHHPYFDDSVAWDETYALGESKAAQDKALWAQRAQMLGLVVQ